MTRSRLALFVHRSGSKARPQPVRVAQAGWAADRIDRELGVGPAAALALVEDLEPLARSRWPAEPDVHGGVWIDSGARRLAFFGGDQPLRSDPRIRRLRIGLLARIWPGWEVVHCHGGVADLAIAAGIPVEAVLAPAADLAVDLPGPPWCTGPVDCVVAIRAGGAVRVHALSWDPVEVALAGPELCAGLAAERGADAAGLALPRPPRGGVSIDVAARSVEVWLAEPFADAASRIARRWPGFAVRFTGDDPAAQEAFAPGLLRVPAVDERAAKRAFVARIVGVDGSALDALFDEVRERLAADRPVAIDPRLPAHRLAPLERAWIVGVALGIGQPSGLP